MEQNNSTTHPSNLSTDDINDINNNKFYDNVYLENKTQNFTTLIFE